MNVRSRAGSFGNAAVVLKDLRPDLTFADLTIKFRMPPSASRAWNAGAQNLARMLTESTLETEALRSKIHTLAKL